MDDFSADNFVLLLVDNFVLLLVVVDVRSQNSQLVQRRILFYSIKVTSVLVQYTHPWPRENTSGLTFPTLVPRLKKSRRPGGGEERYLIKISAHCRCSVAPE